MSISVSNVHWCQDGKMLPLTTKVYCSADMFFPDDLLNKKQVNIIRKYHTLQTNPGTERKSYRTPLVTRTQEDS